MNKIKNFIFENYFWLILIIFCLIFLKDCSQASTIKKLSAQNKELVSILDSLKTTIPNEERLLLLYQREKYEFLKLSLYDWNTVVRTTQRPDDIIKRYDDEIKIINNKLK